MKLRGKEMLLAIDVGNTNMVFGLYEGEKLRGSFRISTNAERTSDELGMQISQYYHFHGIDRNETRAVIIASVVPPVMYTLINAIRKYLRVRPVIAGRDVDIGIENCYANPREVGADRLVNAVSAVRKYGNAAVHKTDFREDPRQHAELMRRLDVELTSFYRMAIGD